MRPQPLVKRGSDYAMPYAQGLPVEQIGNTTGF